MKLILAPLRLLPSVRASRAQVRAAQHDWEHGGRVVVDAEWTVAELARELGADL